MTAFGSLTDWNRGDSNRSRAHLQEPVDALRQAQIVAAGAALAALTGGDDSPVAVEMGIAQVTNAGPNGEADFDDAMYWLQRKLIKFGDMGDPIEIATDTTDQISYDSPPNIFPATNLPEWQADTHLLAVDGTVQVMYFAVWDAGSPQQKHYLFYYASPTGMLPVNVSQSGGANGTDSAVPTYTYNATEAISGISITGGPFSVTWGRAKGSVTAGTHGTGFYNSDGDFVLWQVDEVPDTYSCPAS
jgi:hypothetical protein